MSANSPVTPEDAVLFIEKNLDEVQLSPFAGGTAAAFSMRSPSKDTPNEDAAALIPYDQESGVLIVADGAGGTRGGAQASSTTVYELVASLEHASRDGTILREAILDGIENANNEISALQIGAATTVAVAEIRGNRVRPYHVGDSQILLLGQKGKQKLLTMSHSPVGYALSSGLIDEKEAMHHLDRHYVSNVVGSLDMTIEMGMDVELSPRDTLLVACDGLFDNLTIPEVIGILRKGDLAEATRNLVVECIQRMGGAHARKPSKPDDLTLITFRLDPSAEE